MISFISGTLFNEEPCCKFMLKNDIKNYFRQFIKTLSISFQWNTSHTDLGISSCVWLEQLNVCTKYGILSEKKCLFYSIKFVKYIKLFKIQGTSCYDVNITCLSSPKGDLLKFVKFKFRQIQFCLPLKNNFSKFSVKVLWRFQRRI